MPQKKALLSPIQTVSPFEIVYVDWVTAMPTSSKGNKAFIVMIDGLTRFAEARAFRNATALNGQRFMMDVMLRYGLPLCVTADQGTHFSAEFSDLLQRMGFVMLIPRLTIRCQREVWNVRMDLFWKGSDDGWKKAVLNGIKFWHRLFFAVNSRRSERHHFSPLEALTGITARTLQDVRLIQQIEAQAQHQPEEEDIPSRLVMLDAIRDDCIRVTREAAEKAKLKNDRKVKPVQSFEVGEPIYTLKIPRRGKLTAKWEGPYLVSWTGDFNVIEVMKSGGPVLVSVDYVKRAA